jgi:S1-C subfamily serine protease
VTNYHVVRNARSAQIAIISPNSKSTSGVLTLAQQTSADDEEIFNVFRSPAEIKSASRKAFSPNYQRSVYKATVVGVDPGKDIAVLKVEVEDPDILYPISVGTSTGEYDSKRLKCQLQISASPDLVGRFESRTASHGDR